MFTFHQAVTGGHPATISDLEGRNPKTINLTKDESVEPNEAYLFYYGDAHGIGHGKAHEHKSHHHADAHGQPEHQVHGQAIRKEKKLQATVGPLKNSFVPATDKPTTIMHVLKGRLVTTTTPRPVFDFTSPSFKSAEAVPTSPSFLPQEQARGAHQVTNGLHGGNVIDLSGDIRLLDQFAGPLTQGQPQSIQSFPFPSLAPVNTPFRQVKKNILV